jgi:Electron transfer DM13
MRRSFVVAGAAVAVVALALGLWAFQPWRVFTSQTLDEALPSANRAAVASVVERPVPGSNAQPPASVGAGAQPAQPAPVQPPAAAPPEPVVLAQGNFVDQEHPTSGVAKIVKLPDGSRYLRLESFATSDGPDVHVWLTDRAAGLGTSATYDDGRTLRLGKLRATNGNQNYPIPPDADLAGLRSVVIWCDRFNVAFGSAPLAL